jgi:DNA-binding NtrC family response regulator
MQAFLAYDWPGNVRELENACERMAESAHCGRIGIGCVAASVLFHRPLTELDRAASTGAPPAGNEMAAAPAKPREPSEAPWSAGPFALDEYLRGLEAALIRQALAESGGNKSQAARLLGVKRSTLGDRINRCGGPTAGDRDSGPELVSGQ